MSKISLKFYPRKYQRKSKFNKKKTEEEKESAKPLDYDSLIEEIKGTIIMNMSSTSNTVSVIQSWAKDCRFY